MTSTPLIDSIESLLYYFVPLCVCVFVFECLILFVSLAMNGYIILNGDQTQCSVLCVCFGIVLAGHIAIENTLRMLNCEIYDLSL